MTPWSEIKEHIAEDITILCNNCHRRAGAGIIPSEAVREGDSDPISFRLGTTSPEKVWYTGHLCRVFFGDLELNFFPVTPVLYPILLDTVPVFGLRMNDGRLSIDLNPFPSLGRGLKIVDNEIAVAPHWWDVEWIGTCLTIRLAPGEILFRMRFEPPSVVRIERALFIHNGLGVAVDDNGLAVLNTRARIGGLRFDGYRNGLAVGDQLPVEAAIKVPILIDDPRRIIPDPPEEGS